MDNDTNYYHLPIKHRQPRRDSAVYALNELRRTRRTVIQDFLWRF